MYRKALILVLFSVLFVGCATKGTMVKPDVKNGVKTEKIIRYKNWTSFNELSNITFGYDKYELNESARKILQKNAEFLNEYKEFDILIEGHCDKRGTIEYNLGLGQMRALKVSEYYKYLGVDQNRIKLISFGEERPIDSSNNESAWAENRRSETKIK